nr:MAG TPA: hypothetical protein [Caudoviricetes sp.]DAV60197.1 MAG TPA: hypothetical protein [Caudoviricetes sp.]
MHDSISYTPIYLDNILLLHQINDDNREILDKLRGYNSPRFH